MAWSELVTKRIRNGKTWHDSDTGRNVLEIRAGTRLHYESTPDSGVYDAQVDMLPVRVNTAAFDGWLITDNAWHYALGRDLENHGTEDGWVGFGGRQGQNWIKFRLQRVGYLNYTTKRWQDLGGLATYNRASLASETETLPVGPNGDTVRVQSKATWAGLWPGVSISWRVDGRGLKEEITVSETTRNNLPVPQTGYDWFGFLFKLDVSDVPQWMKNAVVQGTDFDDADAPIEARDALERLLAFLPIDYAWSAATPDVRIRLRKRLWRDGNGDWWLLTGARVSELAGLPAGAVVFDPTLTLDEGEAGANVDTAIESDNPTLNNGTQNYMYAERSSGTRKCLLEFAIESSIPAGSTIDDADLGLYVYNVDGPGTILLRNILSGNAGWTEVGATWNTIDGTNTWAGSAGCSTEGTDYSNTALGSYTVTGTGAISIALAVAQVEAWLSGNYGFVIYPQNQASWNVQRFRTSEASTASERPSLTVVYTEGGGTSIVPHAMHYARMRRAQ